jgi:hypothetical protein
MRISKRGAICTAAVAAGVTAAGAAAVPPPPDSTFEGQTSQANIRNHGVRLTTDAEGRVTRFAIQWRGNCNAKGKFWTSTSVVKAPDGLKQDGDVFSRKRSYLAHAGGGITGKIRYTLSGQFTDDDNANGTWAAKVTVRRDGKKIDKCRSPKVTWSAARSA